MKQPIFGTSHSAKHWLSLDCCGLTCAAITEAMIIFSQIVLTRELIQRQIFGYQIHVLLFNILAILSILSHLKAMLSDPGAVPRDAEPLPRDISRAKMAASAAAGLRTRAKGWCHRCRGYKPPRAHHDSVTGRCIVKLDHFCPWTNNAIGVRNHKLFLLFLLYVCLLCFHALSILAIFAFHPNLPAIYTSSSMPRKDINRSNYDDDTDAPLIVPNASLCLVAMFAILFGLFTFIMLCDQWSVVTTHVAKIDRLKGDAEDLEAYSGVNEIFGASTHRCRIEWLLPTLPRFPHSIQDEILGYQTAPASRTWIDPELGHSLPDESKEASATPTKATPSQNEMLQSPLVQATSHQGVPNTTTTNFSHVDNPDSASPRVEIVHPDTISTPSEKEAPTTNDSPPAGGLRSPIGATLTASTPSTSASNGSGDTIAFNFLSFVPLLGRFLPGNSSSEKKTTRHAE
mmetsp:Transcript_22380/g.28969  ORF Transcript_22380/g.28969 Transcript_22380/m.28969 type:complete len:457 (-) Transcript_22380:72-1442(-)